LVETVNQANNAVPNSRKVNGKALSGDVSLSAGDVGAFPSVVSVNNIPSRSFIGPFSGERNARWAKGINVGLSGDVGQIYVSADGVLHAYFLNSNGDVAGGSVGSYPVGSPIPWPLQNVPAGYLACNGQSFNKTQYSQLAVAYPSGVLPDLRGEFIRGWDDSRGVDPGRVCGSWQEDALQNITGSIGMRKGVEGPQAAGAFTAIFKKIADSGHTGENWGVSGDWNFNASRVARTANETRPRNIAFNYIVRAA
uniref:phage tail protein n=1 Tax=Photorhabdus heterorhabditis TaxID=880156 RepID=UPI001BD47A82